MKTNMLEEGKIAPQRIARGSKEEEEWGEQEKILSINHNILFSVTKVIWLCLIITSS